MTHTKLTPQQSRNTQALNRTMLALSRERRALLAWCKSTNWGPEHRSDLLAAHTALRLGSAHA